jgi:hypothetical protein
VQRRQPRFPATFKAPSGRPLQGRGVLATNILHNAPCLKNAPRLLNRRRDRQSDDEEDDDEDAELDAEMMSQLRAEGAAANRGRGGGSMAAMAAAAARRRAFEAGLPPLIENMHVGGGLPRLLGCCL